MSDVDIRKILLQLDELLARQKQQMAKYQISPELEAANNEPQKEAHRSVSDTPQNPVPDERHRVVNLNQVEQPRPEDTVTSKGIRLVKRTDLQQRRKYVHIALNGTTVRLQLDTTSDFTIVSQEVWAQLGRPHIHASDTNAVGASGDCIDIIGKFNAYVTIQNITKEGCVYVTRTPDFNVMGIDTIEAFDLWSVPLNSLCAKNPDQHHESLGRTQLRAKNLEASTESLGHSAVPQVDTKIRPQHDNEATAPVQPVDLAVSSVSTSTSSDHHTGLSQGIPGLDRCPSPPPSDAIKLVDNSSRANTGLDAHSWTVATRTFRKLSTQFSHHIVFQRNRLLPEPPAARELQHLAEGGSTVTTLGTNFISNKSTCTDRGPKLPWSSQEVDVWDPGPQRTTPARTGFTIRQIS